MARSENRNALAHAVPYTVSMDDNGRYQPGLMMHGKTQHYDIQNNADMHRIAQNMEDAIPALTTARFEINKYMESIGRSRQTNQP